MATTGLVSADERQHEPTRALYPDDEGFVDRDGVPIFYEVYGQGAPTIVFLCWSLVYSRAWKPNIPYLARHARVIAIDPRGNGRSGRPSGGDAYHPAEFAGDTLAVLDATGTESAWLVPESAATPGALILATDHPERVAGVAFVAPFYPNSLGSSLPTRVGRRVRFMERDPESWLLRRLASRDERLAYFNNHKLRSDYPAVVDFVARRVATEDHSTRMQEDIGAWMHETDGETVVDATAGLISFGPGEARDLARQVRCPVLVLSGSGDAFNPPADACVLAKHTAGRLQMVAGVDHAVSGRRPTVVNLALRDFIIRPERERTAHQPGNGRKRALFMSSPIGLGHVQRDLAIARELRNLIPGLEVEWLAQEPVTRALEAERETIVPDSVHLASESAHFCSEAFGHELNCFEAFRRMDEIQVANFMVFHDLISERQYDLWIADEGWEIDHFLHEHPELKTAPFAWLSDFVGNIPLPEGGDREAFLTADYNAEMVEHVRDHPGVRDCSIFIGEAEDCIEQSLGPGLPTVRAWTEQHFLFAGYIMSFDPAALADRAALRAELGYREDERVCIVAVGGSGIGEALLTRVIDAYPEAKALVPELRMIAIAGPRIDPQALPAADGLQVLPYVHNLHRHLAACDVAVVQGGLGTTMELTATGRPFLYFPLKRHYEQLVHVDHRLRRHHAGRRMDYDQSPPELIAQAIAVELDTPRAYMPVPAGGARRAAERIAELL